MFLVAMLLAGAAGPAMPALVAPAPAHADSTAVLGPLATYAEPHCYDLCAIHGDRLTAPRGWEIYRTDELIGFPPTIGKVFERPWKSRAARGASKT